MARYNSVNSIGSVAQGSTISSPFTGLLTTITTGSGTTNLPNPVLYAGSTQTFYNSTVAAVTLSTPSGNINGPGTNNAQTLSLPAGSVITLISDGTNYIAQDWLGGVVSATAITANSTLTANSTVTFNPAGANISLQPTGSGTVTINPAAVGSISNVTGSFTTLTASAAVTLSPTTGTVTINPTATGNIDNAVIGNTTPKAGTFSTVKLSGSYNTFSTTSSGQMGILGHNAMADQSLTNRVLQQNNSYYGHFIRMYYNDGIAFHTRTNAGTAGDVLYDLATPANQVSDVAERVRISPNGTVGIGVVPVSTMLHVRGDWISGHSTVKAQTVTSYASGGTSGYGVYDSDGTRKGIFYGNSTAVQLETAASTSIYFNPGGVQKMSLNTSGNLTVAGTTISNLGYGYSASNPATNAAAILAQNPNAVSGWYWISFPNTVNGVPILTYCDMTGAGSGSGVGGWMRIDDNWLKTNWDCLYDNFNLSGPPAPTDTNTAPYNAGPGVYQSGNTLKVEGGNSGATTVAAGYYNIGGTGSNIVFDNMYKFAYFGCYPQDGELHGFRLLLPSGSRGIRVTRLTTYAIGGPDGSGLNDTVANSTGSNLSPTNAQIVSMGEGNNINLTSNYSAFGVYFGDGSGVGKRLFYGNYGGPSGQGFSPDNNSAQWCYMTTSNFQQWDDIGSNADRVIWYESDGGPGERSYLYRFTFWVK